MINIVPLSHIFGYEVFVKCVILNVKFAVLHSSGADESKQLRDCKDAAVSWCLISPLVETLKV